MGRSNYLTLVQLNSLRSAVQPLIDVWRQPVCLVGSSLERADFRDVDLRMILPDKKIARHFHQHGSLLLTNHIISAWLTQQVALPIDFQFQPRTEADAEQGERHLLPRPGENWARMDRNIRYRRKHGAQT